VISFSTDLGSVADSGHRNRSASVCSGTVAKLTIAISSPALDGSASEKRTGTVANHGNLRGSGDSGSKRKVQESSGKFWKVLESVFD